MSDDMMQKALRLKELDSLIIRAIATSDVDSFAKHVFEFNTIKKHIRSHGLDHPLVNLEQIDDPDVRLIIQKVMSSEPFPVEAALSESPMEEFLKGELDENDIESLADLLYSWFSHQEYIQGIYEIGSLTLSCGKIPDSLSRYVQEARQCYAFQQYNAVFSLCRVIVEVCIKDIATTCNILPADVRNIRHMASRTSELYSLIDQLCDNFVVFDAVRTQLHRIRKATNPIIHGNRLVKRTQAKEMLKETLLTIHRLYELESARQGMHSTVMQPTV